MYGVAGPGEGARRRLCRLPGHLELHDRRVCTGLDIGVEEAAWDDLLQLTTRDDELRGGGRVAEDGIAGRARDLGAEVLVEVGVLLWAQREREGYKRGRNGLPQRG